MDLIMSADKGDGSYQVGFWIGGTELGHLGTWQWMDTGRTWQYTNWLPGQPNNPQFEHCLDLWTLRWNDADCSVPLNFVCEYSVYEPSCKDQPFQG